MNYLLNISLVTIILFMSIEVSYGKLTINEPPNFLFSTPKEQNVRGITDALKERYKKDAARLALKVIAKDKPLTEVNVTIPDDISSSIYQSLLAIHLSDLKKAKEVTNHHRIHTAYIPSIDRLVIIYDRNADWAKSLRAGDNKTTNPKIEAFCTKYSLKISTHFNWDESLNGFNLVADKPINMAALVKDFQAIPEIKLVDLGMPSGDEKTKSTKNDANDISIQEINGKWIIDFEVKFGLKSEKKHIWSFRVDPKTKKVEFLEEKGEALPDWMK